MRLFSNVKRYISTTAGGGVPVTRRGQTRCTPPASLRSSISRKTPATAHMLKYGRGGGGGGAEGYRSTVRGPEPPSRKAVSTPRLQRATSEERGVSHAGAIQDDVGSSNMAGKVQAGACTLQGSSSHANMSSSHPTSHRHRRPFPTHMHQAPYHPQHLPRRSGAARCQALPQLALHISSKTFALSHSGGGDGN